jgi:hypothetical protein
VAESIDARGVDPWRVLIGARELHECERRIHDGEATTFRKVAVVRSLAAW